MVTENGSQNEIVWNGQVLYKSVQEYGSGAGIWKTPAEAFTVYEIYSPSTNPQMEPIGWDSEDDEKKVVGETVCFCRDHGQANYPDGRKETIEGRTHSSYHFKKARTILGVSAKDVTDFRPERVIEINLLTKNRETLFATFQYNAETGELETIELPFKTGTPEDNQPIFYPRVKYNLKLQIYVGREDKPLKTQTRKPEVISYKRGYSSIEFDIEGLRQMVVAPNTLKVNDKNPFDQFTGSTSNDWVNEKLLQTLEMFSSTENQNKGVAESK